MRWRPWFYSIFKRVWLCIRLVVQFVVRGPSYGHDEPPGLVETWFPWGVRIALIVGSWLVAWLWVDGNIAAQLGWTLAYAGAVAISLFASFWFYIFVVDFVFSALWFVLTRIKPPDPEDDPYLYWIFQGIELVNRQLSHIQAFLIWMGVLLPFTSRITFQIPALLGLAFIGPALLDWITQLRFPGISRGGGELQSARRPLIYGFEVLGLFILVFRSTDQQLNLLRLVVVLVLVMAIRIGRHMHRERHVAVHKHRVAVFRGHQRRITRGVDVLLGPVFMLISVIGVLVLSLWVRQHHEELAREGLDGPPPDPQSCIPEPGGPIDADISVFLVADSQVHELGGARFPGQTELADLLVPSAVRPVELDMLGAASVAQLQRAFENVVRDARNRPVFWAHLGDFADLGCTGELERAIRVFSTFTVPPLMASRDSENEAAARRPKLAGIAPGNHDMSFTGNFFWSPYWTNACKSSRANKSASNALIGQLLNPAGGVLAENAQVSWPDRSRIRSWLAGTGGPVTATELGTIVDRRRRRSVVAIFADTSDDATFDWGIAGLFGTYSRDQDVRLRRLVQGLKVEDPLWVVFAHHPLGELTGRSRERLENTLAWLDDDPLGTAPQEAAADAPAHRLLAIVAAHTHRAETHRLCIAKRVVREIVVGSTLDSAQQGAVLELGTDRRGVASLRVKTVPTVARPGFTCPASPSMVDAEECQRIVARLKCDPSCEPLFEDGPKATRDCGELEQNTTLGDAVRDLMSSTNPVEPSEIKNAQRESARRLLTCVCRMSSGGSTASADAASSCGMEGFEALARPATPRCEPLKKGDNPLDDGVFADRIQKLLQSGDEAQKELACLSWAASAQQQHKAKGMTFASALRCAFDDETIPAAQESVATLEVQPCQ